MTNRNIKGWPFAAAAILGAFFAVLTATTAHAQTLPKSQAEFEQQVGITAAQKAKIAAINAKYKPQVESIDGKYKPKVEALQKQMTALSEQRTAEIKPLALKAQKEIEAVFSPAQKAKMKQIQTMMQQQQQGAGMTAPAGAPH